MKELPNVAVYNAHFFAQILKKILFIYILERGREREREGEKHQCVAASGAPPYWRPDLPPRLVP